MACPVHIPSCNKRFQRRAGSTNRFVLSCKRGRRCCRRPLRLQTIKDRQTGFLFAVGKVFPFAPPLHIPSCNKRFQRRVGSINRLVFSYKRGRRCLVALSAYKYLKIGKQVFCLPSVKCSHRIPSEYTKLQ